MPKRVCHSIKTSSSVTSPDQFGNFKVRETTFCGNVNTYIRNEVEVLSPKDQAKHEKFCEDQKINPWPLCKSCEKVKLKLQELEDARIKDAKRKQNNNNSNPDGQSGSALQQNELQET